MTNNKKNILIVMNNMRVGGAEKALISLLQTFDYSSYNVDLYLFKKEGLFLKQIPTKVNLLDVPEEYEYFDMSFIRAIIKAIKQFKFDIVVKRILFAILFKTEKNPSIREQKAWRYIGKVLKPIEKKYDVTIGFLEKTPNYFCVDKVNSKIKIGFVNNDYEKLELNPKYDEPYFNKLDYIATVSEECLAALQRSFPNHLNKLIIIKNISSSELITKLALEPIDELYKGLKLITLGRLAPQKGYDLLIESAKIVKENNIDFKWYILGIGELQNELNNLIAKYNLQNNIVFLGLKENPYPYIRQADIYIQTSRFEGKSLAIDEAKILKKPIIVTNFSTAKDQITNGSNGMIVEMNPQSIANGIIRLMNDDQLQNLFSLNLASEKIGNEDEVLKLYQLFK